MRYSGRKRLDGESYWRVVWNFFESRRVKAAT
jgi:hypothetical protein